MFQILNNLFFKGGMYWDSLASTTRSSMEVRDVFSTKYHKAQEYIMMLN